MSTGSAAVATAPTSTNALRLKTILGTKLDSPDLVQALTQLSSTFGPNTKAARRNLRGDIEKRSLAINKEFLSVFAGVQQQLDAVAEDIAAMGQSCEAITKGLADARVRTAGLLQQTKQIKEEGKQVELKSGIVKHFLDAYQLSAEDAAALTAQPLEETFFVALARVRTIHSECKALLKDHHQKAGLEAMDAMTAHQDGAYERLYRWVQQECRSLDKDVAEIPPVLRKAVVALRERPLLFKCCLDEVAGARRTAVARGFIDALSKGGPHGMPRPIEIHAHDPVRYIGDMLAWLHQAVAWEDELLCVLFNVSKDRRKRKKDAEAPSGDPPADQAVQGEVGSVEGEDHSGAIPSEEDRKQQAKSVLGSIFEGVCRNFRVRFEQAIVHPGIVVTYKVATLLEFYAHTLSEMLTVESPFVTTLKECTSAAHRKCHELLAQQGSKLARNPPVPPPDVSPPQVVVDSLLHLNDLLKTCSGSLSPPDARAAEFKPILDGVVGPLLQACNLSAAPLQPADMAVYLVNCLHAIRTRIAPYDFASSALENLDAQMEAHMDTLVTEQTRGILEKCGVADKLAIIERRGKDKTPPLAEVPGMEAEAMATAMRSFDRFLSSTSVLVMPECDRLISTHARQEARSKASALVATAYEALYAAVTHPDNNYQDVSSILLHSPDQVKVLLA